MAKPEDFKLAEEISADLLPGNRARCAASLAVWARLRKVIAHAPLRALSTCTETHKTGRVSTTEPSLRCHLLTRVLPVSLPHVCCTDSYLRCLCLPIKMRLISPPRPPFAQQPFAASPAHPAAPWRRELRGPVKFHYKQHALQRQIYETHLF